MRPHLAFTLAGILLAAPPASGLEPRLLKDINTVPVAQGSAPQGFARAGGLAFFAAEDGESGSELWRSDGTPAGTFRLADSCPGECSGSPAVVANTGSRVFFSAFDRNGFGPVNLWVTDGSVAGTTRLAGPLLLPSGGRRSLWLAGQEALYFAAHDLRDGFELWRSDGTAAGTSQVTDLRPGFVGSEPAELTEAGGRLYFRADDGVRGPALWTTDGTAEGMRLVLDPLPQSASHAGPDLLRGAGGALYFVAPVTSRRSGLWRSDGTSGGTVSLVDFSGATPAQTFLDASVLADRLLFVAVQAGSGAELWASDGTRRGTRPLTRFGPASPFAALGDANPRLLPERALRGRLVFRADDGVHGDEPWVTDGTVAGTHLLRDLCPGFCSGAGGVDDAGLAGLPSGGLLFFSGDEGSRGFELWATDGTEVGTRRVRDLCRGACSSEPSGFRAGEGEVYLLGRNGLGVPQLWRSDGTAPGTLRLSSFPDADALAGPVLGTAVGGAFLFGARDGEHGRELWRSDGTPQTTRLLQDLNREDFGGSFPVELMGEGGRAWFFADDGSQGFELWASDGTEEGTGLIHEFTPGPEPITAPEVAGSVGSAGRLFFLLQLQEVNLSLWRSAGTPGSTERLSPPALRILASEPLRALDGRIFFVAADAGGEELWTSDGTALGTRRVADLAPGAEGSEPRSLTVYRGQLFFTARLRSSGRELWRSDGTEAGTVLVKDIDPRPGLGSDPEFLTVHGDRLFFPAAEPEHGRELWTSDGTGAGTRLAAEVTPGGDGVFMTHLVSSGPHLFFSGGPAAQERHGVWVSDGTSAGTRQVGFRLINVDSRPIAYPGVFGGQMFFATEGDQRLWRSDGTEEGTLPLHSAEGVEIDEPEAYRTFAGRLFFTAGGVLYETDGSEAATRAILRLAPPTGEGPGGVSFELASAGGRLLFRSWDFLTGTELWALEGE